MLARRAMDDDEQLLVEVEMGNWSGVKKMLARGTKADGSRELSYRPLMAAAKYGYVRIMKQLLAKGASVDAKTTKDGRDPCGRANTIPCGTHALHGASFSGKVEALNVLLEAGANPNATDSEGYTALMGVCSEQGVPATRLAMVQTLLDAGANPDASSSIGMTALHMAASSDSTTEVLDLLYSRAPNTLNRITVEGVAPLLTAAQHGREKAVAKLVALGATDGVLTLQGSSALLAAVQQKHLGVLRILLGSAKARNAVGGINLIPQAMGLAVAIKGRTAAKMLQLLIDVEGEARQRHWAGMDLGEEGTILHASAAFASLGGTHVLLAAGASEEELNADGGRASSCVGAAFPCCERDSNLERALCRMLERGPAFRARSWLWPRHADAPDGKVVTPVNRVPLGVRIYRATDRRFLSKRFDRYSMKHLAG